MFNIYNVSDIDEKKKEQNIPDRKLENYATSKIVTKATLIVYYYRL